MSASTNDKVGDVDVTALRDPMPLAEHLGITITAASTDAVEGEIAWRPELCTVGGVLHGGALMALADSLGAVAAFPTAPPPRPSPLTPRSLPRSTAAPSPAGRSWSTPAPASSPCEPSSTAETADSWPRRHRRRPFRVDPSERSLTGAARHGGRIGSDASRSQPRPLRPG